MELLTTSELAARLRMNPGSIYRWRYQGLGPPAIKVGSRFRYRLSDVEAWEQGGGASGAAAAQDAPGSTQPEADQSGTQTRDRTARGRQRGQASS